MSAADEQLQRTSFGGLDFPVRTARCKGSFRRHEHVYLKTPGAATEKQSRGLYRFEMAAVFDVNVPGFKNLWPGTLSALRKMYEQGTTAALVYPSIGSVPCWIPEWDQELDMRIRSGETAQLIFHEEQSAAFLEQAASKVSSTSVQTTHAALQLLAGGLNPRPDIFDQIQDAMNNVLGFVDQAQLQQSLMASKIEQLSSLITQCDRTVEQLEDPSNFAVTYALQDLLSSTLKLAKDVTLQQGEPGIYIVQKTMSVGEISTVIYKDTKHFDEIVGNNRIEDPFKVPAGTQIIYFKTGLLNAA